MIKKQELLDYINKQKDILHEGNARLFSDPVRTYANGAELALDSITERFDLTGNVHL